MHQKPVSFSALLRMLQPQLSVDERMEGAGVLDMSYEKHFLEHFHKASFNLLHDYINGHKKYQFARKIQQNGLGLLYYMKNPKTH